MHELIVTLSGGQPAGEIVAAVVVIVGPLLFLRAGVRWVMRGLGLWR